MKRIYSIVEEFAKRNNLIEDWETNEDRIRLEERLQRRLLIPTQTFLDLYTDGYINHLYRFIGDIVVKILIKNMSLKLFKPIQMFDYVESNMAILSTKPCKSTLQSYNSLLKNVVTSYYFGEQMDILILSSAFNLLLSVNDEFLTEKTLEECVREYIDYRQEYYDLEGLYYE